MRQNYLELIDLETENPIQYKKKEPISPLGFFKEYFIFSLEGENGIQIWNLKENSSSTIPLLQTPLFLVYNENHGVMHKDRDVIFFSTEEPIKEIHDLSNIAIENVTPIITPPEDARRVELIEKQTINETKTKNNSQIVTANHPHYDRVIIRTHDRRTKLYAIDGSEIKTFDDAFHVRYSFSPSGKHVTEKHLHLFKIWDLDGNLILEKRFRAQKENSGRTYNIQLDNVIFDPQEKVIIASFRDGRIKAFDLDGNKIFSFKVEFDGNQYRSELESKIIMSPCGNYFLNLLCEHPPKLYDLHGNHLLTFDLGNNTGINAIFLVQGKTLAI